MRDRKNNELVAVKFIERGERVGHSFILALETHASADLHLVDNCRLTRM